MNVPRRQCLESKRKIFCLPETKISRLPEDIASTVHNVITSAIGSWRVFSLKLLPLHSHGNRTTITPWTKF